MNRCVLISMLALCAVGCATSHAPSSPASKTPPAEQQAAPPPPPPPRAATPEPASAPSVAPGAARSAAQPADTAKKESVGAGEELDEARGRLDEALALLAREDERITRLSGSACGDACRALASMERAARAVCELVPSGERSRCDDAVAKLHRARRRVRDACGVCADGPSTDPDAPLR